MHVIRDHMRLFVDTAVRRFNKAELIDLAKAGQRRNQADIGAFRRFYRAHATVVRMMHVTDFEASTFTR